MATTLHPIQEIVIEPKSKIVIELPQIRPSENFYKLVLLSDDLKQLKVEKLKIGVKEFIKQKDEQKPILLPASIFSESNCITFDRIISTRDSILIHNPTKNPINLSGYTLSQ